MTNCAHVPCPDCEWCPCWVDDPAGNTPPGTVIPHHEWHQGLALPDQALAEFAHAPAPVDLLDDESDYVPGAAS